MYELPKEFYLKVEKYKVWRSSFSISMLHLRNVVKTTDRFYTFHNTKISNWQPLAAKCNTGVAEFL